MTTTTQSEDRRPLVGIYTPELEGFYFGELVGQLMNLCRIKHYRVSVIKTGSYGTFTSQINTEDMDMVVVLRNAIHVDLAKDLLEKGKHIVSIAYDYFPLDIPMVTSDNATGVDMALTHLLAEGHKKFLFVGNLTNYDIRKRYEAFCEKVESFGGDVKEEDVFQVDDDWLSGGYQAADRYYQEKCTATAVICGTSMNGIGFASQLEKHDADLKDLISLVAFDAISLIPVLDPNITTVDQNLNLIAHKALAVVDYAVASSDEENHHKVAPKLLTSDSEFMKSEDAYLATSFELGELYNANYMKSVLCNLSEWSQSIAENKLNNIMMLRPLFKRYLNKASISRAVTGKSGVQYLIYTKIVGEKDVVQVDVKNPASASKIQAFPFLYENLEPNKYDTVIHLPRYKDSKVWGYVSIYGVDEGDKLPCSLTGFVTYLDSIVAVMNVDLKVGKTSGVSQEQANADESVEKLEGEIHWDKESNDALWDSAALEVLGFTSDLEQKIYQHMELYDRLERNEVGLLREYLLNGAEKDVPISVHFRHKSREVVLCDLCAQGVDDEGRIIIKLAVSASEA